MHETGFLVKKAYGVVPSESCLIHHS